MITLVVTMEVIDSVGSTTNTLAVINVDLSGDFDILAQADFSSLFEQLHSRVFERAEIVIEDRFRDEAYLAKNGKAVNQAKIDGL